MAIDVLIEVRFLRMIQAVLSTQDPETIQLTLDRLPLDYVNPLVNELSILLQGKHAR